MRVSSYLLSSLLCFSVACGPPTKTEPDAWDPTTEVSCELGIIDDTGTFVPITQTTPLELVLGFQGFLLIIVHARIDAAPSGSANALTSIAIGTDDPVGGSQNGIGLTAASAGRSISGQITVFLDSGSPTEFVNRDALLSLRLVTPEWFCVASATGLLVDEDDCIHTGDQPICPDAGP